jgi:hypothetical protein
MYTPINVTEEEKLTIRFVCRPTYFGCLLIHSQANIYNTGKAWNLQQWLSEQIQFLKVLINTSK